MNAQQCHVANRVQYDCVKRAAQISGGRRFNTRGKEGILRGQIEYTVSHIKCAKESKQGKGILVVSVGRMCVLIFSSFISSTLQQYTFIQQMPYW